MHQKNQKIPKIQKKHKSQKIQKKDKTRLIKPPRVSLVAAMMKMKIVMMMKTK